MLEFQDFSTYMALHSESEAVVLVQKATNDPWPLILLDLQLRIVVAEIESRSGFVECWRTVMPLSPFLSV
jgi:hypothetical protein